MLPNLVIIGAMKAGTTSLRHYLDQHPAIAMARGGLNFFSAEHNWHRGVAWYAAQFDARAAIRGEQSPRYTNYPHQAGVPARMAAVLPHATLLYLVREPIARLVSHWRHFVAEGLETRSLPAALAALDDNPYVDRGRYATQIAQYLPYFARGPHIVFHEDLRDRRGETLRRLFTLLGVDPDFETAAFHTMEHRTDDKPGVPPPPVLPADLRARLRALYRPEIERLAAWTGRDLRAWQEDE